ncbi:hypothetical protein, partial [Streptomyces bambusae]|uniref:hypothetical protein n=1 Tax=Streptomyces bambusae TaxID=1550616 RepID=UPI001CA55FF9
IYLHSRSVLFYICFLSKQNRAQESSLGGGGWEVVKRAGGAGAGRKDEGRPSAPAAEPPFDLEDMDPPWDDWE